MGCCIPGGTETQPWSIHPHQRGPGHCHQGILLITGYFLGAGWNSAAPKALNAAGGWFGQLQGG